MQIRLVVTVCLSVFLLYCPLGFGSVPSSITVQGRLTDAAEVPLPAGPKSFIFRIFNAEVGGIEIWPSGPGESQSLTSDANGLWIGLVGAAIPLTDAVFADTARWLEINVDGTTLPRVRLDTGPFAFRVATVDGATGGTLLSKLTVGSSNLNTGNYGFVVGDINVVSAVGASVTGGTDNTASGDYSHVGGGEENLAQKSTSTVAGGSANAASGDYSAVAGGLANRASDTAAYVGGGISNVAAGELAVVAGGGGFDTLGNTASGARSAILGGAVNLASGNFSTVGGGLHNHVTSLESTIGGGQGNLASGDWATVGGGRQNQATVMGASVGGGEANLATDFNTVVGGGLINTASRWGATIAGGYSNIASGVSSTIGGGAFNCARGSYSTVAGGGGPFASDSNSAFGAYSTVPGGSRNVASGSYSFAAGRRAKAMHDGAFVWADFTDANFSSTLASQFLIRASGGFGLGTASTPALLNVYESDDNADVTQFTGTIANAGINLVTDYAAGNYGPGLFWSTQNNNSGKPKAGIFLHATAAGSEILFGTSNLYTAGITNTAMVIDPVGRVGLGDSSPEEVLDVVGNVVVAGTICATGAITGNSVACPSDVRFKKNIQSLSHPLESVEKLRGVRFEWRKTEFGDREFPDGEQIGLIAQEVREVVPQAVIQQADGYLAVDYARLVPLLLEAIKAQGQLIEQQKERIANLEKILEQ